LGQPARERLHLGPSVTTGQGNHDVESLAAGGTRPAAEPHLRQQIPDRGGREDRVGPGYARTRIYVHDDRIGPVQAIRARVPWVELHHAELDQADQPGQVVDQHVRIALRLTGLLGYHDAPHRLGNAVAGVLLEEAFRAA